MSVVELRSANSRFLLLAAFVLAAFAAVRGYAHFPVVAAKIATLSDELVVVRNGCAARAGIATRQVDACATRVPNLAGIHEPAGGRHRRPAQMAWCGKGTGGSAAKRAAFFRFRRVARVKTETQSIA